MSSDKENNLISIEEVISRAKKLGVDFGRGNPRERLRYLTKIKLLPHARRKSFNGQPPNGAYPEYVIGLLKEIDEKIKAGKSIQEIKKERERKVLIETPNTYVYPAGLEIPQPKIEIPQIEKEVILKPKPFFKITNAFKVIFLVLIFGGVIFFLISSPIIKENFHSYLLASLSWFQKIVQAVPASVEERPETREIFLPASPEPYLTINTETDINAPLNVKETITAPALTLVKDEFKAILASADLTAERTYTFPDLSGTVCLTTGNCIGIGGEITSLGGVPNRLAKFLASREVGVSSIEDFYEDGVAITISSDGKVGIGREKPDYPLHVEGKIQATGDICTDISGGKCLSQLTSSPTFFVGGGGGIAGSGNTNYLSVWTGSRKLGNSIIFQNGSNIGINTTSPAQKLDVAGTIKMLGFQLPTNATSGYVLTSDDSGFGTWQPLSSDILSSGEKVFRSAVPIFRFSVPAQTASTTFVAVSKEISTSTLNAALPDTLPGTTRKFAFLLSFADDISTSASSTWMVDLTTGTDIEFYFAGQDISQSDERFNEGVSHLSNFISPPENNWQLKVKVPSGNIIRIFNILLLVYDQIN